MLSAWDVMMFYPNPPRTVAAPTWTPASLTGLKLWIEADPTKLYTDAGTTLVSADGQTVAQINDKSSNGRNLSGTATYHTGSGKPYLQFNGTSDNFGSADNLAWTDGAGQYWIAAAAYFDNNSIAHELLSIHDWTSGRNIARLLNNSGTSQINSSDTLGNVTTDTGPAFSAAVWHTIFVQITSSSVEIWVDGVSDGPTALTGTRASDLCQLYIASFEGIQNFTAGRIAGVTQGAGVLSSADHTNVQTYMAALHP